MRFALRFGLSDDDLVKITSGIHDADLGGGLLKYRIAREAEGTSGGARALIALRVGQRAVFMFGYEKKDQANIGASELRGFRKVAKIYLAYTEEEMTTLTKQKAVYEL